MAQEQTPQGLTVRWLDSILLQQQVSNGIEALVSVITADGRMHLVPLGEGLCPLPPGEGYGKVPTGFAVCLQEDSMGEALPPRPFFPVQEEVRRLFQELIYQPWGGGRFSESSNWQPRVDMCETPEAIIVEVELPGVRREDVRIEIEGDFLHITGERHANSERQERNYYRLERSYGRFERQLRLPGSVAREAIRAEFEAGILIITLPKRERREIVS